MIKDLTRKLEKNVTRKNQGSVKQTTDLEVKFVIKGDYFKFNVIKSILITLIIIFTFYQNLSWVFMIKKTPLLLLLLLHLKFIN